MSKLIVFEGIDHSGKTTQAQLLKTYLTEIGVPVKLIAFPNRESETGKLINTYLKSQTEQSPQVMHLLFSANRWEKLKSITKALAKNKIVILDRYTYSGIVYSVAQGLNYEWCAAADKGLPEPDIVFYFNISATETCKRYTITEKYENVEFQNKILLAYNLIKKSTWQIIDAAQSPQEIHAQIKKIIGI